MSDNASTVQALHAYFFSRMHVYIFILFCRDENNSRQSLQKWYRYLYIFQISSYYVMDIKKKFAHPPVGTFCFCQEQRSFCELLNARINMQNQEIVCDFKNGILTGM